MKKKNFEYLNKLVSTPSVTGSEQAIASVIRNRLAQGNACVQTDIMGCVCATLEGNAHGENSVPTLLLAAHTDEIGLMVTSISSEGYISFSTVGGVDAAILPGQCVHVHIESSTHPLVGVIGRPPIHLIDAEDRKKVTPVHGLIIDLGMKPKTVKKLVHIGDVITIETRLQRFGTGMVTSRALDDKCGVWVLTRMLEKLEKGGGTKGSVTAAFTTQEEIGTRGAIATANSQAADVAIAFDVTHATDYPGVNSAKHGNIKCGAGPVIGRGPNVNPVVFDMLVKAAKKANIKYQIEALPGNSGTDAWGMQVARGGIATGVVSVPLRYMHTPTEVISLADLEAAVKLLVQFAKELSRVKTLVPGLGLSDSASNSKSKSKNSKRKAKAKAKS